MARPCCCEEGPTSTRTTPRAPVGAGSGW
jgi:hypothetical protein